LGVGHFLATPRLTPEPISLFARDDKIVAAVYLFFDELP
jgi:hypothetical protein